MYLYIPSNMYEYHKLEKMTKTVKLRTPVLHL